MSADRGGAASRIAVPGAVEVLRVPLDPADGFPNNPKLPLFVYKVSHRWLKCVRSSECGALHVPRISGSSQPPAIDASSQHKRSHRVAFFGHFSIAGPCAKCRSKTRPSARTSESGFNPCVALLVDRCCVCFTVITTASLDPVEMDALRRSEQSFVRSHVL